MSKEIKSLAKLSLNKETLVQLDKQEAESIKGGIHQPKIPSYVTCLSMRPSSSR